MLRARASAPTALALLISAATMAVVLPTTQAARTFGDGPLFTGNDEPRVPTGLTVPVLGPENPPPFVDLMKSASPMYLRRTRDDLATSLPVNEADVDDGIFRDADGYPTTLPQVGSYETYAAAVVARGGPGGGGAWLDSGTVGDYALLWEGDGDVEVGSSGNATTTPDTANRAVVQLHTASPDHAYEVEVRIMRTNAVDPVHGIRLVPLSAEETLGSLSASTTPSAAWFALWFLDAVQGLQILRFTTWQREQWPGSAAADIMQVIGPDLDPQEVPESLLRTWAERPTTAHATQASDAGAAVELMVALANAAGAAPWLSIPYDADTEYVSSFATHLATQLDEGLDCYVEYSTGADWGTYDHYGLGSHHGLTTFEAAWVAAGAERSRLTLVLAIESTHLHMFNTMLAAAPAEALAAADAAAVPGEFGVQSNAEVVPLSPYKQRLSPTELQALFDEGKVTVDAVVDAIRGDQLAAEDDLNAIAHTAAAHGLDLLAFAGGPFVAADSFAHRYELNYRRTHGGSSANILPINEWGEDYDVEHAAALEQELNDVLIEAMSDSRLHAVLIDAIERFRRVGGRAFVAPDLFAHPRRCSVDDVPNYALPPTAQWTHKAVESCGSYGLATSVDAVVASAGPGAPPGSGVSASAPMLSAVRDYAAGLDGAFPLTRAGLPAPAAPTPCDPSCQWGVCMEGACVCYPGYGGDACGTAAAPPAASGPYGDYGDAVACMHEDPHPLGLNVRGVVDWATQLVFIDMFKTARQWIPQRVRSDSDPWTCDGPADTILDICNDFDHGFRADGYPATLGLDQAVGAMMARDLIGHYPRGKYLVLWDGDGSLTARFDGTIVRRGVGLVELDVVPQTHLNNGIFLRVTRTNPDDPIRNIRVYMPGFHDGSRGLFEGMDQEPLYPPFVRFLQRLRVRTIRTMEWSNGIGGLGDAGVGNGDGEDPPMLDWDKRVTPDFWSQAVNGVALEHHIAAANWAGADLWLSLPFAASDDYVLHAAELIRDTLRPDVGVWVEWSNEVWGTGERHPGGVWAQARGLELGLTVNSPGDGTQARLCFLARRTHEIGDIFKATFNATGQQHRVSVVISSQSVSTWVSEILLSCVAAEGGGDIPAVVDALGIAPYFDGVLQDDALMSIDNPAGIVDIDTIMDVNIPAGIDAALADVVAQKAVADAAGIDLVTYECGPGLAPGLTGGGENEIEIAAVAHLDARMAGLVSDYLSRLSAAGVSHINYFSSVGLPGTHGSWGMVDATDTDPTDSAKWRGATAFVSGATACEFAADGAGCPVGTDAHGIDGVPCSGRGECVDGQCYCYYGRMGDDCADPAPLVFTQCAWECTQSHLPHSCDLTNIVEEFQHVYGCTCDDGYYGYQCALFNCTDNCGGGAGVCVGPGECECHRGHGGDWCEVDCGCDGHGSCSDAAGGGTCLCEDDGWRPASDGSGGCEWDCDCDECVAPGECACSDPSCSGHGTCFDGLCECWAGFIGRDCENHQPQCAPNHGSPFGMGLRSPRDWSTEWVYTDVFQHSREWISQSVGGHDGPWWDPWNDERALDLRPEDGYPASLQHDQAAATLIMRDVDFHYPDGAYVLLHDGDGDIQGLLDCETTPVGKGRLHVEVELSHSNVCDLDDAHSGYCGYDNGCLLRITRTNPADPVRNIRVYMPGFEQRGERFPFHPTFLQHLSRYNTLRFMQWTLGTGGLASEDPDDPLHWGERTGTMHHSQVAARGGVSLEHQIQLCNILGANMWLNIPISAADDYVQGAAELVRDTLRPDVMVTVELGNEGWGTGNRHPTGEYAQAVGLQLGLHTDSPGDPMQARLCYMGQRTREVGDIFRAAFSAGEGDGDGEGVPAGRLRVVLASITVWDAMTEMLLDCDGAHNHVDALAIAPYFGAELRDEFGSLYSLEHIFAETMPAGVDVILESASSAAAIARARGLELVMYEGGPSVAPGLDDESCDYGGCGNIIELGHAVHRDARIGSHIQDYLDRLLGLNVTQLMWHDSCGAPSRFGSWGIIEATDQDLSTAVKYQAVQAFIDGFVEDAPSVCSEYVTPGDDNSAGDGDGGGFPAGSGSGSGSGEGNFTDVEDGASALRMRGPVADLAAIAVITAAAAAMADL